MDCDMLFGYTKPKIQKMSICTTPHQAMRKYMDKMTSYEHHEIFRYTAIYFLGLQAKKIQGGPVGCPNNCGYDDDEGFYKLVAHDHIAYRYEVLKRLGKGSFGQVVKAYDHKLHRYVALKVVKNDKDSSKFAEKEIHILKKLKQLDKENNLNVVHLFESFRFRNHTCMIFELLGKSLHDQIVANNNQGFSLSEVRKMAVSILQCLELLERNKIMHCDLKPENLVLKTTQDKYGIKVIDFGCSDYDHLDIYQYVQTRFYRAPEVMLGNHYGMPVDMWSFGCVLAELLTGNILFPGENEDDQMACIMEVLGMPPQELLNASSRGADYVSSSGYPLYCTERRRKGKSWVPRGGSSPSGDFRGPPGSRNLVTALDGCNDAQFLDFLTRCLQWDPATRMTPSEALRHPWIRRHLPKPGEKISSRRAAENRAALLSVQLLPSKLTCNPSTRHQLRHPTNGNVDKVRYR
ncbi:dual specificity tyrosine-phosphorylation-regulated kinase 2-like [Rhinophrynus dorsalis]